MSKQNILEHWGLTQSEAEIAGLTEVASATTLNAAYPDRPALEIPYFNADATRLVVKGVPFQRVRFLDNPPQSGFIPTKAIRYVQPPDSGVQIYLYPGLDWERIAADPTCPVIITEGEAKAIVGCRLMPTIGLGGVFNFTDHAGLHKVLEDIKWEGRPLFIVFDSDAAYNSNVLAAESRLVDELYIKRHAKAAVVRIPSDDGADKTGLDDYVKANGVDKFKQLLEQTPTMRFRDAQILGLNRYITWVEYERLVCDRRACMWLPKDVLTSGSKYSTLTFKTFNSKGAVSSKSVAKEWLTHPLASRVDEAIFRPGENYFIEGEHGRCALNIWQPQPRRSGDVTPFLELTAHLSSRLPPSERDLPLKLIAYKAQHPQEKIPLALVLIGPQGSGKSFWGELVRDSFGPYGVDITPASLNSQFQGWLEHSLLGLINEASTKDLRESKETLKALISDLRRPMNEKYRPVRDINSYTMYIITSNERGVGAYDYDDRRMVVVDCPPAKDRAFYDNLKEWRKRGGAEFLADYLLEYDLGDWRPPAKAPTTPEKYIAFTESLTQVQRLAEDMRTADHSMVKSWLDSAKSWAESVETSSNLQLAGIARATLDNLPNYQVRPWYTADELVNMFPAIASQYLATKSGAPSPGKLSRELRDSGVPYLINANDPRGFMHHHRLRQYLVVAQFDRWREPIDQATFDMMMNEWPKYGEIR